ncbi:MAG TPA: hypothetical protein VJZ91_14000 [Blastocatellia bacterium]|nr:hypothetical protein [Blastocatellia bacterium]
MARRRGCLAGLFFIAILIVAALLLAPVMPLGWLKPRVESRLSATLGRPVTVESLRLNFFGGPYLTIRGLTAKEDAAFGGGDFLKADELRADISLTDYALHRQVVIETMTIRSPEFTFVKNSNGAWSWTTLGHPPKAAEASPPPSLRDALMLLVADAGESRLRHVAIDQASVRLVDKTGAEPPESLYKNVALAADIAADKDNPAARHATGTLRVDSNDGDGAELLKADMPFDFTLTPSPNPGTTVKGSFGPGPLESKNFNAGQFKVDGEFLSASAAAASGKGHISASDIRIASVNVSERVASAARVNQIGDMNEGTGISRLETDFNFAEDVVNTTNLQLAALDGLGDATAPAGWFKMKPELTLNYAATVVLSRDAAAQLRTSANPLIGAAVAVLSDGNGLEVPLNITGDVRHPQVEVDIMRALGMKR